MEKKPQILIAHQKERMNRTKKVRLAAKKIRLETRGFRVYFWEVDHLLRDVIGVQDFGKAKNYKPTWTKTSLRLVFVLRWNYFNS